MSAIISTANQVLKHADHADWTNNQMTVEGWFKHAANPADYGYGIAHGTAWTLYTSGGSGGNLRNPGTLIRNTTPTAYSNFPTKWQFPVGHWFHIAATWDFTAGELKLYLNGKQVGSTVAISGSLQNYAGELWLGSNPVDTAVRNIKASELRIWHAIRTQTQIKANMRVRLTGSETNLKCLLPLDESAGNTANDLTANNHDFTATSASWDTADNPVFAVTYTQTRKFTIDHTKVGGASGTITDFPIVISGTFAGAGQDPDLRTVANGGDIENTDTVGGASGALTVPADLAFYDDESKTTQYDHQFRRYDPTTGRFVCILRIPTLNKASDTDFWMHYSAAAATKTQESVPGVFDDNFIAVYPLNEAVNTNTDGYVDHSGNGKHATGVSMALTEVDGPFDKGQDFDGSADYIIRSSTPPALSGDSPFTLSAWVNPDVVNTSQTVFGLGDRVTTFASVSMGFNISGGVNDSLEAAFGGGEYARTASGVINSGAWQKLVLAKPAGAISGQKFYVNGSSVALNTESGGTPNFASGDLRIASFGTPGVLLNGKILEIRISKVERDADWETTDYNNQNSPSTFYTITGGVVTIDLTETITLTDTVTKLLQRSLSETSTMTDVIDLLRVVTIAVTLETLTLTDSIIKTISKALTETSTMTDTLTRVLSRSLSETLTMTGTVSKLLSRGFTESFTLTDKIFIYLNGFRVGLWSKITRATGTWTKAARSTGVWTKITRATGLWSKQERN